VQASLLAASCSPKAPAQAEPNDPASSGPPPAVIESVSEVSPAEPASAELTSEAPEEPAPAEPRAAAPSEATGSASSTGELMTEFFGIGRGDRVADLGGVSGYSLTPVRRAIGPAGVIYVRRSTPPPSEAAASSDDLGKIVWMNTPEEAPLTSEATGLNAVTMLYGYHAVIAARKDRRKLNTAVYRALVPGGVYIIADHAAPAGSGLAAAREQNAIEDGIVRSEVQAAGFEFVEAADFVSNAPGASERSPGGQYVLKFRKPK
jgi:predicted methyltransferase